jgi:RimJ/RimL family protein N-acetyltransferase
VSTPVRIEGIHVVLRPLEPHELDAWEASWPAMPQGAAPYPPSRDRLRERIARSGTWWGRSLDLAIEGEGRLIGQIGVYEPPSGPLPEGVHQFGIMLFDPADRGRGFGTEAVRLLCDWLFREQSATRVEAGTLPANEAMRGVLSRLGFVAAGTEVEHDVEYLLFALDRATWASHGVESGS